MPARESAVKKPGALELLGERPKSEGAEAVPRLLPEFPKLEPGGDRFEPVPTLVIRGKAGADIEELFAGVLPKLPLRAGAVVVPTRAAAPEEVVV